MEETIFGTPNADLLGGTLRNDLILGFEGADTVFGNQGSDRLFGNLGSDQIYGGQAEDTVYGGKNDDLLFGNRGNDFLNGNRGNDTLYGGQGNDVARGGKGADLLFGDRGNDVLYGDLGADTLTGGEGIDKFVLSRVSGAPTATTGGPNLTDADVITDFTDGSDLLGLAGGLRSEDLDFVQITNQLDPTGTFVNSTAVRDRITGEFLAILQGITPGQLSQNDVTTDLNPVNGISPPPPPPPPSALPDLSITKADSADPVNVGDKFNYTLTVSNTGTSAASNIAVEDILPAGLTPTGNTTVTNGFAANITGQTVSFTGGSIAAGSNATLTIEVTADTTGSKTNTATVDPNNAIAESNETNNSDTETTGVDVIVPPLPGLAIAATNAVQTEGDTGGKAFTFTVTRTGDTTVATTVDYAVTGGTINPADATDFVGGTLPTGTVSFMAGETSQIITLDVNGDTVLEPNENFVVTLSNASGGAVIATPTANGTIQNDDASTLVIAADASAMQTEGDAGSKAFTFTVTRSGDTSGATDVNYAVTGGMTNPADATDFAGGMLPTGTVSFMAGESSQIVTIDVNGDTVLEQDENFVVTLSSPTGGATITTATADGTIVDDDAISLAIAPNSVMQAEGNAGNTAFTFTVTRSGNTTGATTVDYAVTGGITNPTDGMDFGGTFPSGTVSFMAGETSQIVTVNVSGDTVLERDENFVVTLANPSGSATLTTPTANGTIENDDAITLDIAATNAMQPEGDSGNTAFTFTVTRNGDTSGATTVDYAVMGGTADGMDFGGAFPSGMVSFAAGELTQLITVNVSGDIVLEPDEDFVVTLSNPTGGATIGTATANGTIENDDAISLAIAADASAMQAEGNSGTTPFTFTVTRSGDTTGATMVDYAVTGGVTNPADGMDFGGTFPTGSVSFAAGEVMQTVTIDVSGDTFLEPDDNFVVTLSNPTGGTTIITPTANGTIVNDDAITLDIAATNAVQPEGNSGTTAYTFTVTRSGDTSGATTADYAVTGGMTNPADGMDFGGAFPTGMVSFAAGELTQLITINVSGDSDLEPNEDFIVTLSNPTVGATIGTATANGTIQNDDVTLAIAADASAMQTEGNTGTKQFTFTVTRAGDTSGATTADYALTGGATNPADGMDFGGAFPSGMVSFAAGETSQMIVIDVSGDSTLEPDENFVVTLSNASAGATITTAAANGTIVNDDASLAIAADASAMQPEGNSGNTAFTFTVTRTGDTSGATTVDYAVTGGATPANATDFAGGVLPSGTVNFIAGDASETVTINVNGDGLVEPNEDFVVTLTNPSGGAAIAISTANGTIVNDDVLPTITNIDDGDANDRVSIGEMLTYTITFSKDIDATTVTAADFDNAGTATITIGTPTETTPTSGIFTVTVTPTTTGTIILRVPTGAVISDVAGNNLVVPIQDDDTIVVNAPPVLAAAAAGTITINEQTPTIISATGLGITDDETNTESATISITGGFVAGQDVLSVVGALPGGITANTSVPGTITLTGSATLANYTTALRQIAYTNTSDAPNTATRTVSFTVNDGDANSNTVTRDITVQPVNNPPTRTPAPTYTSNANLTLTVPDGASDLLTGATDPDGTAVSVVATTLTSTAAAATVTTADDNNVTVNADGSFTYRAVAGFVGNDTFVYQIQDSGTPLPAATTNVTATITVNDLDGAGAGNSVLWFIDEDATTSTNIGTQANPFRTLAAFNAANTGAGNNPADTDFIFIDDDAGADDNSDGAGTYGGGITLRANQKLIGDGSSSTLAGITGITLGSFNSLDAFSGTRPTIAGGITLNSGNTLRGLNAGNASVFSVTGGAVGNLTISEASVNNTAGGGFNVGTSGALNVVLDSLSSSGGTNGVNLNAATGNFTANSGTITNPTGVAFNINGGSANVTYNGTIAKTNNANNAVNINAKTGGTTTFGGAIAATTSTANAIELTSNTGSTVNFTGALTLNTTSGIGFNATGGGTVSATGTGSAIASTTGTALNVANTTIGASGLNFRSISSNGATNGIVLNNTGASGGLTVTGTGTTAGSGGTIQNSTGTGILLTSTANVNLSNMNVQNSGDDGILGTSVTGFSLNGVNVTNNGNSTTDEGIELVNPAGAIVLTNTNATGNAHNNVFIDDANNTGGNSTLAVSGGTIGNHVVANGNANSGMLITIRGTAILGTSTISGVTFENNRVIGLQVTGGDTANVSDLTVSGNTFRDTGTGNSQEIGLDFSKSQQSNMTAKVLNNTFLGHNAQAMNFFTGAGAGFTGTYNARIEGNVIGNNSVDGSGSIIGNGIRVNMNGDSTNRVLINNNQIFETPNGRGIEVIGRNGIGSTDLTITNNNVDHTNTTFIPGGGAAFPLAAIFVQSNTVTVTGYTVRADVRGNTVTGPGTPFDLLPTYIALVETSTSNLQLVDTAPASADATAQITSTNTGSASANAGVSLIAGPINTPP